MRDITLKTTSKTGVESVRYDGPSQSLYVRFPRGGYRYQNVPQEFVARLEAAESGIGEILAELRDKTKYPVEKL
jgi:KTSC domain